MRKIAYKVENADKKVFETKNYDVATARGNRIEKIILTTADEMTEAEKEKAAVHARKIQEILKRKRA